MHLLVIGASGRTGTLVVDEALRRGHTVTALVRNPESFAGKEGLTIIKGTPLNSSDINTAFLSKSDLPRAVIVTLNSLRESDSPFSKPISPPRFMADSVSNLRSLMQKHGVRKIVIMSAFGTGDSFKSNNFMFRAIFRHTNMSAQFKDHDAVDAETKESGLDWVLVRSSLLKGEEVLPVKVLSNTGKEASFLPSISRPSVAGFLVDAAEKNTWNRSTPVICN